MAPPARPRAFLYVLGPLRFAGIGLCLAAMALCLARTAVAEDEPPPENDVSAQVKAQMEKIIRLMRENEQALLELSTGGEAAPRRVDVDVPPPEGAPPSGSGGTEGSSGSSGSSGSEGTSGGTSSGRSSGSSGGQPRGGEGVRRAIDELIRGQRQSSSGIPGELEELVRMIPT